MDTNSIDEILRIKQLAEESNRAKSLFLARMSHEIRTPITAVLGISEIQLQNEFLSPEIEEAFEKIYGAADKLLILINDILDMSKIEAGKLSIVKKDYKISNLLRDAVTLANSWAGKESVKFLLDVDENLPVKLTGDFFRIWQILTNLLSNAFKYTDEGSVSFALRAEEIEDRFFLLIKISDTGIGMSSAQLDKIKENYTRFHQNEKQFIAGVGLGIPIVDSLVTMMNGELEIESTPGDGTTVTVRIPQKIASKKVLGAEAARVLETPGTAKVARRFNFAPEPMPYGKVLLVDDVESNIYVAAGLMKFYGLNIDACTSGFDAVTKVKSGRVYDIIFMDYMMPGMSGFKALEKIRAAGYKHPVIVLTANAMLDQEEEYTRQGFDGFISKPIKIRALNDALIKFIRDKQPPEVLAAANRHKTAFLNINDFMSSDGIMKKLRADFAHRQKNTITELESHIAAGDFETAHRTAHNLKTSSALIGETVLSKAASEIEPILRNENVPDKQHLNCLAEELQAVLAKMSDETFSIGGIDKEKAAALLEKIAPLLASRNVDSLEYLEELRRLPEAATLAHLIENFDFSAAEKVLKALQTVLGI